MVPVAGLPAYAGPPPPIDLEWRLAPHALLRKEVIQPHLPIRLPCYDFTPIIDPTLDGCVPRGFAHRLWVLSTLVV